VTPISGRAAHPQTQGKNERLHQTLQKCLDAHRPIFTDVRLTELVDQFDDYYNTQRPHQSLDWLDETPDQAYQAKPKALPASAPITDASRRLAPGRAHSALSVAHTRRGPYHHFKGATPIGDSDHLRFETQRHVLSAGSVAVCGCLIYIGRRRKGQLVHIIYDD
jgi:hypothetical protein